MSVLNVDMCILKGGGAPPVYQNNTHFHFELISNFCSVIMDGNTFCVMN